MNNQPEPKKSIPLTRREIQLIARLRQLRNLGRRLVEIELEDGPKVKEGRQPA